MYYFENYVYGKTPQDKIRVAEVKPLANKMLLLKFLSGETRLFDCTQLEGPVFEPLDDPDVLRNASVDHGVVTWMDGAIDCAPEYMYEHSYEYCDMYNMV